ncbi:TetR/AcrR family transcriptional regulator [Phenylobacterium aquaticum]|uniref:TetR/AcrR family transcriptional regulator n=1 Tax=Phenylobacterium aquaticum TaxID=1763816 RepID=UPI0026F15525|nr:TetR/AcrR family transcriptional regulator [Phenylobacterium aquaticum]
MSEIAPPDAKPARRRQADRSTETRDRLIEAAITCLHQRGYAQTTVSVVAEAAGVSRGAMTHQFPAKTDLMVAVVRAVFRKDSDYYEQSIVGVDLVDWMRNLPWTLWGAVSAPSGIAVMEIMLASRSDPQLAERLRDMQMRIDTAAHAWIQDRRRAAGLVERPDGDAIHRLVVAAARGLALEALFRRNSEDVGDSIAVLAELLTHLYPPAKA